MKKVASIFLSVMLVSALFVVNAHAGTFVNGDAPAGATLATEIFGTDSDATVVPTPTQSTAVYTMASAPGAGAAFIVEYTLGNGATWGDALTAGSCAYGGGGGDVTIALTAGGGTDDFTASFRVDVTVAMMVGDTFTLTYDVDDADSLATADQIIPLGITLTDTLSAPVDTAGSVDALTSEDGTTEVFAASAQPGTLFIDVATGSINFGGTSADKLTLTSVRLGTLTVTDNAGPVEDDGTTEWAHGAGDATCTAGAVGPPLAGTYITLTGEFAACVAAPGDVTVTIGGFGVLSARTLGTITASTVTLPLTNAQFLAMLTGAAQNVDMIVDGVTAIPDTTPVATMNVAWAGLNYGVDLVSGNLRELKRNGTTVYPGIVIGSGYGYEGGFRIVNRGASAANIYFQVQNYDGAMLPQVTYSGGPLAAGATVYIPTDTVLTEGGLTTTSSANGIITVESSPVDVYQISYKSGGYTIVPLTKANNQTY